MRVQAFITSGILEKYVLGMVSEEETLEVLDMASQHIEVKEEIAAIRKTIKGYILSHQVAPPESLKDKVLGMANSQPPAQQARQNDRASTRVSPYQQPAAKSSEKEGSTVLVLAFVLLGVALLAACFTAYNFYKDLELAKSETVAALDEVGQLKKQQEIQNQNEERLIEELSFYTDRNNEIVLLKGTRRAVGSKAVIYWNAVTKTAFVDVQSLPTVNDGKVLVLWASSNGRSNKIGVLEANAPGEKSSIAYLDNPKSFFLTEESDANVARPSRNRILMRGEVQ